MENVIIKIIGMPLSVPNGISILEAARYAGIEIPTLSFLKDINEIGTCRICMVEVKGKKKKSEKTCKGVCFPRGRGYGNIHQYREGQTFEKDHS